LLLGFQLEKLLKKWEFVLPATALVQIIEANAQLFITSFLPSSVSMVSKLDKG
jgi:hypothetical protein